MIKVVVKKPEMNPEIMEVEGISGINKLVGNVDENGNGYKHGGTDIRMLIGKGVDMYVKEDALNNVKLGSNLWTPDNMGVLCGTIVFAGYNQDQREESGACSLTEEQIKFVMEFIAAQSDEWLSEDL